MGKVFRPSTRESSILSKIGSSKEHKRRLAISSLRDCMDALSNALAMKLVENSLVETTNKNSLEEQIRSCLEKMTRASDFDIDYQIAPVRNLVPDYNIVSLYLTAFIIEKLLDQKDNVDIFGSDEDIYLTVNQQVKKHLPVLHRLRLPRRSQRRRRNDPARHPRHDAGLKLDNFEGLARHRGNRFFLVNDDNDVFVQRTLLLYVEIVER